MKIEEVQGIPLMFPSFQSLIGTVKIESQIRPIAGLEEFQSLIGTVKILTEHKATSLSYLFQSLIGTVKI